MSDKNAEHATLVKFTSFDKLRTRQRPLDFLVQDVLLMRSMAGLVAPPGYMKTFIATDLCATIASGIKWFGRSVQQGPAYLLLGEGNTRISHRVAAFEIEKKVSLKQCPIYISNRGDSLTTTDSARAIGNRIATISDRTGVSPALVCIDPVARALGSSDENAATDMVRFLDIVEHQFVRRFGCTVLLVHHTGHQNNGRARGSSAWKAGLDTEMVIARKGNQLTVRCTKQKDYDEFVPIQLEAKPVDLPWKGSTGRPETSLALVDGKAAIGAGKQAAAMEILSELTKASRGAAIPLKDWRNCLAEREVVVRGGAFDKLRARLRDKALIHCSNGMVRPTKV